MTSRQEELSSNLQQVKDEIAQYSPTLIVVSKTYPSSDVQILAELGASHFGENRSSEGLAKSREISATWHYQGEIQSKKIKEILFWADCIHSLDQLRHAEKINTAALEMGRQVEVFLQLSLDGDLNRGGLIESELFAVAGQFHLYPALTLLGIMCVPPVSAKPSEAFDSVAQIHRRFTAEFPRASALSAGMSGDYLIALDHGATHIRVGSKILGQREYHQ